jgi:BirA family biotin operon repressor/biotin-[acetyl-CoA-carboxylase] ligase
VTDGPTTAFISRLERFVSLGSTQDIVRDWFAAGVPEVCIAVADTQTAGRGRLDRRWQAPPGRALLVSAGFRPVALSIGQAWRVPAVACLAMREAITDVLALPSAHLAVKWPNDLVIVEGDRLRKLGGLLAEGALEGERLATVIVGIGVNVDWPAAEYPPDLAEAMGSLSEVAGRPVDRDALLTAWTRALAPRYRALTDGRFDGVAWADAQVTTGAEVEVDTPEGSLSGTATGIDALTGGLLLRVAAESAPRVISHGDVLRCRLRPPDPRP